MCRRNFGKFIRSCLKTQDFAHETHENKDKKNNNSAFFVFFVCFVGKTAFQAASNKTNFA
jgi:hypothetical protein